MGTSVLIVDDHAGFRASARRLLEAGGYEVVGECADGAGALDAAQTLSPDVVLLDVQLPDADGRDLASQLITDGRPLVVLTSSHSLAELGGDVDAYGACGFVAKGELTASSIRELTS